MPSDHRLHSTNYYCETEPSVHHPHDNTKHIFKEEEFEKVVEFSESDGDADEEGEGFLQFCEEIQEVSDESL